MHAAPHLMNCLPFLVGFGSEPRVNLDLLILLDCCCLFWALCLSRTLDCLLLHFTLYSPFQVRLDGLDQFAHMIFCGLSRRSQVHAPRHVLVDDGLFCDLCVHGLQDCNHCG